MNGNSETGSIVIDSLSKTDILQVNKKYFYVENLNRSNLCLREFEPTNTNIQTVKTIFTKN